MIAHALRIWDQHGANNQGCGHLLHEQLLLPCARPVTAITHICKSTVQQNQPSYRCEHWVVGQPEGSLQNSRALTIAVVIFRPFDPAKQTPKSGAWCLEGLPKSLLINGKGNYFECEDPYTRQVRLAAARACRTIGLAASSWGSCKGYHCLASLAMSNL